MPPLSNEKLCRLLIRPSGEWSTAGIRYHSLTALKSEFGVAKSLLGLCSPKVWLRIPSTWALRRACTPVNCGCTFFPVTKRCPRFSNATRLCCSHPYQSPRLCRSSSPMPPLAHPPSPIAETRI